MELLLVALLMVPQPKPLDEKQVACLVQAAYYEAGNQGKEGRLMVMRVLLNRARGNLKHVCKELHAPHQFSFIGAKRLPAFPAATRKRIREEAVEFLKGVSVPFESATNFHHKSLLPSWTKKMVYLGRVGDHTFWRNPNAFK